MTFWRSWEGGTGGRTRWQRRRWLILMFHMSCRKNAVFSHMVELNGDQHGVVKGLRPSPVCSIFYGPVVENSVGSVRWPVRSTVGLWTDDFIFTQSTVHRYRRLILSIIVKAGLHVRRKHKHKKPTCRPGRRKHKHKHKKRISFLFLVLAPMFASFRHPCNNASMSSREEHTTISPRHWIPPRRPPSWI